MATERVIFIDNGENINPLWIGHIAHSADGVNWEFISKHQLDVGTRIAEQNSDQASRAPFSNKGARALISLRRTGDRRDVLEFDVENVANQASWQSPVGLPAKMLAAASDITEWLSSAVVAAGSGNATAANQLLVLAELQKGKDYEVTLMKDIGNGNLIFREVILWDQDNGVFLAPQYYDAAGAVYVPTGPIGYVDTEAAIIALLSEVSDSTTRTPVILRKTDATGSPIASGSRKILCYNAGTGNGSFNGAVIKPGESLPLNAGGENDVLVAVAYDGTGTELVIITIT